MLRVRPVGWFWVVVLILLIVPIRADAHTKPYAVLTLDLDPGSAPTLTIESHLAAFVLRKGQRPLSQPDKALLASLRPDQLNAAIGSSERLLYVKTALTIDGELVRPTAIEFPSADQVRLEGLAVDAARAPVFPIRITFPEVTPQSVGQLSFPQELGPVFLLVSQPGFDDWSTMLPRGAESATFPLASHDTFLSVASRYLAEGFRHVIPDGFDHLLFVVGLFLAVVAVRPVVLQVTLFTISHSLTLSAVALDIIVPPGYWVEVGIAASIAYVGLENVWKIRTGSPVPVGPTRYAVVFAFGLVHGMGFADALKELGVPASAEIPALFGFNVGVEVAQIFVVLLLAVGFWMTRAQWHTLGRVAGSCAVAGAGFYWTVARLWLI